MDQHESEAISWSKIQTTKQPHRYLEEKDQCWYLFTYDEVNPLCDTLDDLRGYYGDEERVRAIAAFAQELANFVFTLKVPGRIILVPMSPSKKKGDPEYDDRVEKVCEFAAWACDGVECAQLLEPEFAGFEITADDLVIVVDDFINTGAHFKTAQRLLKALFGAKVIGAFLCRMPPRFEKQRIVVANPEDEEPIVPATFGLAPKEEKQGMGTRIAGAFGKLFGK